MSVLITVFTEIAFLILLGFLLRKKRVIDERGQQCLTGILMSAVLPFSILSSSQQEYSLVFLKAVLAVAGAAICFYIGSLLLMNIILSKKKFDWKERVVMIMSSVFANTGFVGFPLMKTLFGAPGLLLASVYNLIFNIFFYTYGMHSFSGGKTNAKQAIFNPVTIASVVSLILFMIPWRFPGVVTNAIDLVGGMTVPLSMIIVGSTLATVEIKKVFSDSKSYIVSALRLVVFPLIMCAAVLVIRRFFYMMPVTATTIVLMTALPCASMNVILSERYDCAPKFCARTFVLSFALMAITMPLMMMLCMYFFPAT